MKTYAINLVVNTKNTDIYDKVALNKFPIIVQCKTESELKSLLSNNDSIEFIKQLIKSKRVYESAEWKIRSIYDNGEVRELVWNVSELNKLDFE
jgi:hypothetical protein